MIRRQFYNQEATAEDLFVAGQKVSPGLYRLVGSQRDVRLDKEDTLPASLDGRVAVYIRRPLTWADISHQKTDTPHRAA